MLFIFNHYRTFLIAILLLFGAMRLFAQETVVVGEVFDAVEKTPIANVNIWFKNTPVGVKSNDEGFFMLRTEGQETTLVFSCVGYRTKEIKLKQGKSVGIQVELQEANNELQELSVLPGANPALALLKKVRLASAQNNIRGNANYNANITEQNVVLLAKINQKAINRRIFEQLSAGALTDSDSLLTIPLFMSENKYVISENKKTLESKNIYSSQNQQEQILAQLTGNFSADLNFYKPTISLFDKGFVSPLADNGTSFYNYYLTDSILTESGKFYSLDFRTKNTKNLAFNGTLSIDSTTMALTTIDLDLPRQVNLNFVKNLHIKQVFSRQNASIWVPDSGSISVNMTYNLLTDSTQKQPLLFLKNSFRAKMSPNSLAQLNFAGSAYQATELSEKLSNLNQTPILKTARWIADALLTGYMQIGKVDVGKIQNLARITDIEGLRLTAPLRTNETLWKNMSLGGYAGYGFGNQKFSYSAFANAKLPVGQRNIVGISYTNDYRRIDYDYNAFMLRENPLSSGDEDIVNTLFSFRSSDKVGKRHELAASFTSDLSDDVEAGIYYRNNQLFSALSLPFSLGNQVFDKINQQSITLNARLSFDERVYNDHLQRIYTTTYNPIFYATLLGGNFAFGEKSGYYAKLSAAVKQHLKFGIGQWSYAIEGGTILGKVPYILLETPSGSQTDGYRRYQFTNMNYLEYAADNYISMHNELNFNGIILNNIPIVKYLNLRELVSFKLFYGTLSSKHAEVINMPTSIYSTKSPYMELGIGVSNILRLFTLQSVWRLSDLNHQGVSPWGMRAGIRVSF